MSSVEIYILCGSAILKDRCMWKKISDMFAKITKSCENYDMFAKIKRFATLSISLKDNIRRKMVSEVLIRQP